MSSRERIRAPAFDPVTVWCYLGTPGGLIVPRAVDRAREKVAAGLRILQQASMAAWVREAPEGTW